MCYTRSVSHHERHYLLNTQLFNKKYYLLNTVCHGVSCDSNEGCITYTLYVKHTVSC